MVVCFCRLGPKWHFVKQTIKLIIHTIPRISNICRIDSKQLYSQIPVSALNLEVKIKNDNKQFGYGRRDFWIPDYRYILNQLYS